MCLFLLSWCLHAVILPCGLFGVWCQCPHLLWLYFEPQPQRQSLLLGEKNVLIFGLKYWSGQEPFIAITSQVSQDNHLAWVMNKQGKEFIPFQFFFFFQLSKLTSLYIRLHASFKISQSVSWKYALLLDRRLCDLITGLLFIGPLTKPSKCYDM